MPGQEGEAKLKKPKFCWFCILDTWNIINLAFLGKPGGLSIIIEEVTLYWLLKTEKQKGKTTDWLALNRLIATARILFVFRHPDIGSISKRAYKSRQKVDIRVFWFVFLPKVKFFWLRSALPGEGQN